MEVGHKYIVQLQCKLNLVMKDIVCKKVIKWVDEGIFFANFIWKVG